jgi:hypothetical protein
MYVVSRDTPNLYQSMPSAGVFEPTPRWRASEALATCCVST